MAWSTPLTAVANAALTSAQWNASVRDNLLETAAAKSSGADGTYYVGDGTNAIAERAIGSAAVETNESTTSTTYVDLATVGPTVTVDSGAVAIVGVTCDITNNTAGASGRMTFAVSGASTIAEADGRALRVTVPTVAAPGNVRASVLHVLGLTAGSNVFSSSYRASAGTASFANRRLFVLPY